MERWKSIPDFPGYEVSHLGSIRSFWMRKRFHEGGSESVMGNNPRLLKPIKRNRKSKYYFVHLVSEKIRSITIHKLVMDNFGPPCPGSGFYIDHIDRDTRNNSIGNLRWATSSQNNSNVSRKAHSSKYHGVYFTNDQYNGQVKTSIDGKSFVFRKQFPGNKIGELKAALWRDSVALLHQKEHSVLNFVDWMGILI